MDANNPQINNCRMFQCTQTWDQLELTENTKARFCQGCEKFVFLCQDSYELDYHFNQSHCIAHEFEYKKIYKIGYYISPYLPPKMTLYLKPTYDLNQSQLNFLSHSFGLGDPDYKLRTMLCDGQKHLLKENIWPHMIDEWCKELTSRNMEYELSINSDQ